MAGSIALTGTKVGSLHKYQIVWTSDASGDVTANTVDVTAGELVQVRFTPNTDANQPSAAYDVTILDAQGIDILAGAGANLSSAASTVHVPVVSTYFRRTLEAGAITPTVSAAGNAKQGTIVLLVRPT